MKSLRLLLVPVLVLSGCESMGPRNPLARTPPTTVGDIARQEDAGRSWIMRQLLAPSPSTLRVEGATVVTADPRVAIGQYEAMIDLDGDPRLHAEALRRAADLRLQRAEAGDGEDGDVEIAIAHYRRILADHPGYAASDRVLYQLARAQQLQGDEAQATASLRMLGERHADSVRSVEARFRAAELLFQQRDYAAAAQEYRAVLERGAASRYAEPAQYKYAWALFQQHQYAQALPVLLTILDRALPRGELADPAAALARVPAASADIASESLRIAGLSFAALGGGGAIAEQLAQPDSPQRLDALLHAALAEQMMARQRYSDAAQTWAAFIARHPRHALAPPFQAHIIEAWRAGGFADLARAAQQDYVERYAADAAYWNGRTPDAGVVETVRMHLDTLARFHHARAQRGAEGSIGDYLRAAHWYARRLALYPDDPQRAATHLLYAEALLDGGRVADAAREFEAVAYDENTPDADAAHAAVLAYRRLGDTEPARRARIDAGLRLAERFPRHPQRGAVLAASAADLLDLGEAPRAIEVAQRALDAQPAPADRRIALSVLADAHYARAEYAPAEQAYAALLALMPADGSGAQTPVVERLAASIYRQGEVLRTAGDAQGAARQFLRVGAVAPQSAIRAAADYDAAAALIGLRDWAAATPVLEAFRARFPDHALIAAVDRKLAVAYDEQDQPAAAAATYARIASRPGEDADARRAAAWRAAQRYDRARLWAQAERAYEQYVRDYPAPSDAALDARVRLAELTAGDPVREQRWLREIVAVARSLNIDAARARAASAQLRLGRIEAENAAHIALALPLERSLPRRVAAMQAALAALDAAADYGFAETTSAATWEIATLYRDLGCALLDVPRPRLASELEREQYALLLEEQAYPFEESAIRAHEANLGRIAQGVWNEWVQRSAAALTELAPARYGKHERRETRYDIPG
ncbi:tetratricopeptide repeat protein [Fontimonas sp. SYSU GA230001]|uniref:tetratricopeptide repeat protein n=1 Tax=Fontimonas sp. SYSU GA230001 TaxID=3142450 RepID=UPI0032B3AC23